MNSIQRPQRRPSSTSTVTRPLGTLRRVGGLALAGLAVAGIAGGCGSSKSATAGPTSGTSNSPTSSDQTAVVLSGDFGLPIEGGWLHYGYSAQSTTLSLEVPEGAKPTVIYQGPAPVSAEQDVMVRQIVCRPSSQASKAVILIGATKMDVTTFSGEANTMAVTGLEGSLALSGDRVFFLSNAAPIQGDEWSVTVGGTVVVGARVAVWASLEPAPASNSPCVAVDPVDPAAN